MAFLEFKCLADLELHEQDVVTDVWANQNFVIATTLGVPFFGIPGRLYVFGYSESGLLTFIEYKTPQFMSANVYITSISGDDNFIYISTSGHLGLKPLYSYSISESGALTEKDMRLIGIQLTSRIWADYKSHLWVADSQAGLFIANVSGSGEISVGPGFDNRPEPFRWKRCFDVQGTPIYSAILTTNDPTPLKNSIYTVSPWAGPGNDLTQLGFHTPPKTVWTVSPTSNWVCAASHSYWEFSTLYTYSGGGSLSYKQSTIVPCRIHGMWGYNNYIYFCGEYEGIFLCKINPDGTLTAVTFDFQPGSKYVRCFGNLDSGFLFCASYDGKVYCYRITGVAPTAVFGGPLLGPLGGCIQ